MSVVREGPGNLVLCVDEGSEGGAQGFGNDGRLVRAARWGDAAEESLVLAEQASADSD